MGYILERKLRELIEELESPTSDDPTDRIQAAVDETRQECADKIKNILDNFGSWNVVVEFKK